MPFTLPIQVDYRASWGLRRRLRQQLGVELDRAALADFIAFQAALMMLSIENYGRVRRINLPDLWAAFERDRDAKGKYTQAVPPDVSQAQQRSES